MLCFATINIKGGIYQQHLRVLPSFFLKIFLKYQWQLYPFRVRVKKILQLIETLHNDEVSENYFLQVGKQVGELSLQEGAEPGSEVDQPQACHTRNPCAGTVS